MIKFREVISMILYEHKNYVVEETGDDSDVDTDTEIDD